ncbi:hypothetical protein PC116_g4439 [Phytophthora cactorum]|uniref:Uncharacterized protein n=1 Tax=Phytophthora cactorum TaxID=29920 RepID=A0A8T1GPA7_9STRA|nr:hypothetical protein Pcac1_g14371 [Phytophthora cactorum]KAG2827448.1 hypothetical protein PC112_g8858 [Phytophthora cactorum]KAG2836316.1 hypothetical protein PC111_g5082 [Phytophthora cactorum]KAG2865743.1 hypothetical protein PC113_g3445 [Phytophthora cactorum]KAG2910014.1 hypothetical protein PC114_g9883 [Phytophthora cactorum]
MERVGADLLPGTGCEGNITVSGFRPLVGSLLWLAKCIRPDISFTVHEASRRTHSSTVTNWKLGKRIMRHLERWRILRLRMYDVGKAGVSLKVVTYSDADFAADEKDRKSVTGGFVTVDDMGVQETGWCVAAGHRGR